MARPRFAVRVVFFVLYGLILSMGISSRRGWLDWDRIRKQNVELEKKIEEAERSRKAILSQIDSLFQSPAEKERVVRSTLGYIRSNEAVIEF